MAQPNQTHPAITRAQARQLDQLAEEDLGIAGIVLMENAGINASEAVVDLLGRQGGLSPEGSRVVIVCGGGNNGGDGYVLARQLHNRGAEVSIYAVKDPAELEANAAVNHRICTAMGLPITVISKDDTATGKVQADHPPQPWQQAHVVVDAILGTGFHGEVRDHEASIIHTINALTDSLVVSLDSPSGLDCDTGEPANACVKADLTVTFAARKVGFDQPRALPHTGQIIVGSIGSPPNLLTRLST